MTEPDLRVFPPRETKPVVPNAVLGTMIFILAEAMFFAGLVSALTIARASVPVWPPPGQPRLPVEVTALNTLALLSSGALAFYAGRFARRGEVAASAKAFLAALLLGVAFVLVQGFEWVRLLLDGLTLTTSTHASFFFLIVGAHALHAVGAIGVLTALYVRLHRGTLDPDTFWAGRLFWYFVVGMWPILYWQVYL